MKIRNRHLVKFAGVGGGLLARAIVGSLRYEYAPRSEHLIPIPPDCQARYLYATWHENLLLPVVKFGHPDLAVLISKHADGQILGSLITAMGMGMVQGSTNRGGVEAVRKLLHPEAYRHLAVTPDGPRGPRRVVQPGIVYIASRTGMRIVCTGIHYRSAWRMRSWDHFAVPKPTSFARVVTGTPIVVPPDLKLKDLEEWRVRVQQEMDELQTAAAVRPFLRSRRL